MVEDPKEIQISVTLGAVTVGITSTPSKEDIQNALKLANRIIHENSTSISQLNGQISVITPKVKPEPLQDGVSAIIASNSEKLKLTELALLALKVKGDLTRIQLIDCIENWGKAVPDSFTKNFSRDFVKSCLMREVAKNADGEPVYGLSEKGKIESSKILQSLGGDPKNE